MNNIPKEDLYSLISKRAQVHPDTAELVIKEFIDYIKAEITKGEDVRLEDFGTFKRTTRGARTYKNKYGEFPKPEKHFVRFDEHKAFVDRINT